MNLIQDLRFSLRLIRRSPVVTLLAIFCLGSGIGLSTFMFSITYAIVGRGLPFPEQENIVRIMERDAQMGGENFSATRVSEFRDIEREQTAVQHLTAVTGDTVTVGFAGQPHTVEGMYISKGLFDLMPEQPMLGRVISEIDTAPNAEPVVLLTHRIWRLHFESDPNIVGQTLLVEGTPSTVIGVMPENYDYPFGLTGVWLPLNPETLFERTGWIDRVMLLGRLNDGLSTAAAEVRLGGLFEQLNAARGEEDPTRLQPAVDPLIEMFVSDEISIMFWAMFVATLLVLFIACTNVTALITARLTARENELAIRSALGANRSRIVTQILSESLVTAFLGMTAGLLVAWQALRLLWNQLDSFRFNPPAFMEFRLDGTSILVAVVLMLLAVVLSALMPSLRASRPNLSGLLNDSGRTASSIRMSRLGAVSAVLQLAFSLALLVAAGRLIYGIIEVTSADYPFERDGLLVGSVAIDNNTYSTPDEQRQFWESLYDDLQQLPGAESVSLGFNLLTVFAMGDPVEIEGVVYENEEDRPFVRFDVVTPGYFDTIGVGLLSGRDFNETDVKGNESVAIVNTVFAERFYPGVDAVGQYFKTTDRGGLSEEERRHRIIGVVPDLAMDGLFNEEDDGAGFYRSQGQSLWGDQKVFARTNGDANALIPEVQRIITARDPNLALTDAQSLNDHIADSFFYFRFILNLFSAFGIMALLLAATGVFGIIHYAVSLRRTEIGIRLSLGATAGNIRWLILKRGMIHTAIGLALGTVLAYALQRVLAAGFLYDGEEYWSYGISILVLVLVAGLANYIPARKASKLDPMVALRVK